MRVASLVMTLSLTVLILQAQGFAEDMLPEREFVQQSIQRIKQVQNRVNDYDNYLRMQQGAPMRGSSDGITFGTDTGIGRANQGQRMPGAASDASRQRVEMQIRSLKRKAGKARADLDEMRRSTADGEDLDRDKIESTIKRLERDADVIERDLRRF